MFDAIPPSIEYIRTGKLRALAVTTATRLEVLPDIPTLGEFLPGYEASGWYGVGAPKYTPAEIIDKLNKEINAGLADPRSRRGLPTLAAPCCWFARRLRQTHRRRDREVGQGDQVRGHQARLTPIPPMFHASVPRMLCPLPLYPKDGVIGRQLVDS